MSGVIKGVGKVLKSVVKVAKKIAVPVLLGAAVMLTAGSAAAAMGFGGVGLPSWGQLGAALSGAGPPGASNALAAGVGSAEAAQRAGMALTYQAAQQAARPTIMGAIGKGLSSVTGLFKSNPLLAMSVANGISSHFARQDQINMLEERARIAEEYRGRVRDERTFFGLRYDQSGPGPATQRRMAEQASGGSTRRTLMTPPMPEQPVGDPNMAATQVAARSLGEEEDENGVPLMQAMTAQTGPYPGMVPYGAMYQQPLLQWEQQEVPA